MSDLISRQKALDLVTTDKPQLLDSDALYMAIEDLASAEPELTSMILGTSRDGVRVWYQCGRCGEPSNADDNYCSCCGRGFINNE